MEQLNYGALEFRTVEFETCKQNLRMGCVTRMTAVAHNLMVSPPSKYQEFKSPKNIVVKTFTQLFSPQHEPSLIPDIEN